MLPGQEERVYYVRHKMHIQPEDIEKIMKEGKIAIHFADEEWDSDAYKKRGVNFKAAKKALNLLKDMNDEGGWVIADYTSALSNGSDSDEGTFLIGLVKRGSKDVYLSINACREDHTKISALKERDNKRHKYKVLSLEKPTLLKASSYGLLQIPFPRGSVSRVKQMSHEKVEKMYKKERLPEDVNSLAPSQLEVLCEEYLRDSRDDLPRLESLIGPIGGSIKDVDIAGIDQDGDLVYAQVTHEGGKNKTKRKVTRLLKWGRDAKLLYFAPPDAQVEKDQGVTPLDTAKLFKIALSERRLKRMVDVFLSPQ